MADAPWVAINVDYWRNPKVAEAGFLAATLHLAAIAYCAEQLTDGFVPTMVVPILAAPMHGYVWVGEDGKSPTPRDVAESRWANLAEDLVFAGLWEEADGGWRIVNYLDHQPSREEVEARKERARAAGRKGGLAKQAAKPPAKRIAKQTPSEVLSESLSDGSSESLAPTPTPTPTPVLQPLDHEVEVELHEASTSDFAETTEIRRTLRAVVGGWGQDVPAELLEDEAAS